MKKLLYYPVLLILFSCSGQPKKQNSSAFDDYSQTKQASPEQGNDRNSGDVKLNESDQEVKMVYIKGGSFLMGSEIGLPNESPVHKIEVKSFYMDKSPVTVGQFRKFVKATGFKTEAEKFGDSGVFNIDIQNWELLKGAYWEKPFGNSGPSAEDNHPVTHVSWNDAVAYSIWAGKRLPSEAEWEFAARSGKNSGERFSWGNEVSVSGKYFANTWQGEIGKNETMDGYLFTSPVGIFGENETGLTDMGGNVWNWCADNYKPYPGSNESYRENPNVKVIRGGSFFFDQNKEFSYSVSGRAMNSHETSLFNTGFHCAKDVE